MSSSGLLFCTLLSIALAIPAAAQEDDHDPPVTKREISVSLRLAGDLPENLEKTNRELIEEIRDRGVNFALSTEEEWALQLQDASPELIVAIREALAPAERQAVLDNTQRDGLYNAFMTNRGREDVASKQIAIASGKEFIRRYRSDPSQANTIRLMERTIPTLERSVRTPIRITPSRRRSN